MANMSHNQNFQPVFLGHAKLYILADKYLVDELKELILHKLRSTLQAFELHNTRVVDIVELARFVYSNYDGLVELRTLVVEYVVLRHSLIDSSKVFEELLQEGGQFVVDYCRLMKEMKENDVKASQAKFGYFKFARSPSQRPSGTV